MCFHAPRFQRFFKSDLHKQKNIKIYVTHVCSVKGNHFNCVARKRSHMYDPRWKYKQRVVNGDLREVNMYSVRCNELRCSSFDSLALTKPGRRGKNTHTSAFTVKTIETRHYQVSTQISLQKSVTVVHSRMSKETEIFVSLFFFFHFQIIFFRYFCPEYMMHLLIYK